MPGQYFLVFLTFPAWRNSFWGALPPMVGQSFLLTGSSPNADSPASAAIWANYQVGNDDGNLPTSSSHLASCTCWSTSSISFSTSLIGEGFLAGDGGALGRGPPFLLCQHLSFLPQLKHPPLPSLLLQSELCPFHSIK